MTISNLPFNLSPKVAAFLTATWVPGVILVALGYTLDDDTLRTLGLGLLAGGAVGGGAGYKASPGEVITEIGPANDDLLPPAAAERMAKEPTPSNGDT